MLPARTNISATAAVPVLLAESSDGPNQCNVDIPTTNALDRYLYVVNFLTSNGLYAVSLPTLAPASNTFISHAWNTLHAGASRYRSCKSHAFCRFHSHAVLK